MYNMEEYCTSWYFIEKRLLRDESNRILHYNTDDYRVFVSWSCGIWIYNNLCKCLLPLQLCV